MLHTNFIVLLLAFSFCPQAAAVAVSSIVKNKLPSARGKGSGKLKSGSGIINGTEVNDVGSKYSYYAMPTKGSDSNEWLGCGASIISPTYGMTANHCFGGGNAPCTGPKRIALWIGDVSLVGWTLGPNPGAVKHTRVLADVICHPQFDGHCSHGHDLVLLKLVDPLPDWVQVPKLNLDGRGSDAVGMVTANMGWGLAEASWDNELIAEDMPPTMRETSLTIMDDADPACARVYAGGFGCSDAASEGLATNKEQQVCAGAAPSAGLPNDRDTCSGDSGSPMMDSNGVQVGIVSYGGGPGEVMKGPGRICGDPVYVGVYTRVSAFKDYIESHVTDLIT